MGDSLNEADGVGDSNGLDGRLGIGFGLGCLRTSWLGQIADVRFGFTVFSNDRADRVVVALG